MAGPLAGIKVTDFTEYIAGPYCTMMLADMGADVVKVERPEGDMWRHTAPVAPYESQVFLGLNRGKRSIALDMALDEGRKIARELAHRADVVVMNYRPGVAERLGLDYESLSKDNPRLVYCENTAFGREGPYAGRPGFDILTQAATGIILYENKLDRGTPTYIRTLAVTDLTTAMFMAWGIVNALFARVSTGCGQKVETNLFASGLAAQYRPLVSVEERDRPVREGFVQALKEARLRGTTYKERAEIRGEYVPLRGRNNYYRIYETKDALIAIACLNNRQRRAVRDALAVDDETVDGMTYDWTSAAVRDAHLQITDSVENSFRQKTTAEWLRVLDAVDVPCMVVNFPEEIFDNEHVVANDLMMTFNHPVVGELKLPRGPVRMSASNLGSDLPPPVLGAHGAEVLAELGYDPAAIAALREGGVLWDRDQLLARDGDTG